ncbi:MAG TPA: glycosyltransferase family 9 protein [Bryobacteraceae bacterium]|nr:glycosyltransferase family 9 protein [Bryobacteraceae bacterium]
MSTGIDHLELSKQLRERLQSFDSIVSWYGSTREEFRAAMLAINPRCVFHWALPRDLSLHATDFYAQQVGALSGLIPRIRVNQTGTRDTVVIHPFSGSKRKNWPLENYRELARLLDARVDWLAGPEEDLPEAHRFDNLAHVAAFLAGARLYIGNDSGITHLAAAVGVKTIAIFGPASPRIWVPRGENVELIAVSDLTNLTPSYVARVANRLLGSRSF